MKTHTTRQAGLRWWLPVSLLVLLGAGVAHAGYVILTDGTKVEGELRVRRDGSVMITSGGSQRTIPANKVKQAVGDKPAKWDDAVAKMRAGKYDECIPLFQDIANTSRGQSWDLRALRYVAESQVRQGRPAEAVKVYEQLLKDMGDKADPDVRLGYFGALLKTGSYDKLDGELDVFIRDGNREQAAKAQIMRGDINAARKQWDNAVLDYMRTAILFESEKAVQPEALFKTAEAMEQLRDARAKDYYKKVVDQYGSSEYAEKARKKL